MYTYGLGLGDSIDSIHNHDHALLSSNVIVAKLIIRIAHVVHTHAKTFSNSTSVTSESDDCIISDDGTRRDESQSEETKLIPLEGASSKIWKYFGFPGQVKTASVLRGTSESETK